MSSRALEWLALVPALVRVLGECRKQTPAERKRAALERIIQAASIQHAKRRAGVVNAPRRRSR
jgi:hypothetical protein